MIEKEFKHINYIQVKPDQKIYETVELMKIFNNPNYIMLLCKDLQHFILKNKVILYQ